MSRSRSYLSRIATPFAALLAMLAFAAPAFAATTPPESWSPRLAYVLTTGSVRDALAAKLDLTGAQQDELRLIGQDLYEAQKRIQRRSDVLVWSDAYTAAEKRAIIEADGYNGTLGSAEDSASARAAAVVGMPEEQLAEAVDAVWQQDAATHRLETELSVLGLTPQALVGGFKVYATRFTDGLEDHYGVALPDKNAKFASLDWSYPSGYPDGTYAVSLYWNGVHLGRDKTSNTTVTSPHAVASAPVIDVGPWNTDDNWWNSYTDPQRPRRINRADISGNDGLVGLAHLAVGLPEAQAAYFNYYGRPARIPAYSTSPMNYWDKPRGYNGQWSGADQFGRQVVSPASIDLLPKVAHDMGMSRDTNGDGVDDYYDNEWIDVLPLWEARLDLVGGVKTTAGPYITGQKVSFTYTVKNGGVLPGTWDAVTVTMIKPGGKTANATYQGPFTLSPGATKTLTFTHTLDATGTLAARPNAKRANVWSRVGASDISLPNVLARVVDRAGGSSRYDTAVEISKDAFPTTAPAVVIATGLSFPDALTGAVLAHAENGPLLLVGKTAAPSVTAEVKRLKPSMLVVLGGPSSVSTEALTQIVESAPGAPVLRLAGKDRYETAQLIALEVVKKTGGKTPQGTAVLATGRDFADAMSVSALAAEKGWPILLTDKSKVPTATSQALTSIGTTNTLVIGSSSVIADSVVTSVPKATRLSGATRYETNAAVADYAESKGVLTYKFVGLTLGSTFPDGLAGAVLAACRKGTMLLTPHDALAAPTKTRLQKHRTVTTHLQAFGSVESVPAATLKQAEDALR